MVSASRLEEEHTLSFWDALIVQAAIQAGAERLLSEDQNGQLCLSPAPAPAIATGLPQFAARTIYPSFRSI
jgi:hypothetical protein